MDRFEVSNEKWQDFARETGYLTDAERLGDSFVAETYLSEAVNKTIHKKVDAVPWWLPVPNASWHKPEGIDPGQAPGKFVPLLWLGVAVLLTHDCYQGQLAERSGQQIWRSLEPSCCTYLVDTWMWCTEACDVCFDFSAIVVSVGAHWKGTMRRHIVDGERLPCLQRPG